MSKENTGPAFPIVDPFSVKGPGNETEALRLRNGMTLRQYAAIKLRVPDSGTEWLDDMIRTSLRDGFAEKSLAGMLADSEVKATREDFVERSYALADAMILERAK